MTIALAPPLPVRTRVVVPLVVIAATMVLWEIAVRATRTQGLVPLPSGIGASGLVLTTSGVIFEAMAGSLKRVAIGFAIGAAIGIPMGLAVGTLRPLERSLRPVLDSLRSIAPIAWIPMAILWLGVRGNAALFVVSYAATFPFIVSASQAVRMVDRRLVDAARALGASPWTVLRAVLLPSTLPMLFTGARIALAFAWGSIIAAELAIGIKIAGQGRNVAGIGQLMVETLYVKRDVDALVFYMLAIGVVSLAIDAGLRHLQRRLLPWDRR
jgi:ABC-type nitrate/sulfonate/bicarbonate transport system permease component